MVTDMQSDYLAHMQKGGQKKIHKYISRYFKNGKWFYRYKVTGEGYKEDAERYKKESESYGKVAKTAQDAANGKIENPFTTRKPQDIANDWANGAAYYGRKAAEAESGYKNSLKSKAESTVEKGRKKLDEIFHPEETISVTSNLMPAGTKKTFKKKK